LDHSDCSHSITHDPNRPRADVVSKRHSFPASKDLQNLLVRFSKQGQPPVLFPTAASTLIFTCPGGGGIQDGSKDPPSSTAPGGRVLLVDANLRSAMKLSMKRWVDNGLWKTCSWIAFLLVCQGVRLIFFRKSN
jgi:hypothetical protein